MSEPPPENSAESLDLDPRLVALQTRLQAGVASDTLLLDATTLGTDGARILAAMQQWLQTPTLTVTGNFLLGSTADTVTASADLLQETLVGISETGVHVVFGAETAGLTAQILIDCGADWTPVQTFENFNNTWGGTISFVLQQDDDAQFVLATDAGPLTGSSGQQVVAGLNLVGKLDVADGPALSLATLITGVTSPLPVIGSAQADATAQSFSTTGTVPNFTLTIPILPTLSFQNCYAGVLAVSNPGFQSPTYQAYILAGADVGVGSSNPVTIPLQVQVPTQSGGWVMGIAPGKSVPLTDLAAFLADFTGLGFMSMLPSQVTILQKLQLSEFRVQLQESRTDFYSLSMLISSIPGDEGQNLWTIIPGTGQTPLLALSGIQFGIQVLNSGGTYTFGGTVQGTFNLSDTLQLTATIPIPTNAGPWTVSCQSYAALPNLVDMAQYLGGQQLSSLLPQKLGQLTSYQLNDLTFVYDPTASSFTRLSLALQSTQTWVIVANWIEITNVLAQVDISNPASGSSVVTGSISGTIVLAQNLDIIVSVYRGTATAPWRLDVFTEEVVLPSLATMASLAGGDITTILPSTITSNSFVLSDLELTVDVTNGKVELFTFSLTTADTWPIITGILQVNSAGIYLNLDWTSGTRVPTGSIWGDLTFCQAGFTVQAIKNVNGWALSASLNSGEQLTLQNLVTAFNSTLWTSLQQLGVPNVTLAEAAVTYETDTGSYSYTGKLGTATGAPWAVGIANISIQSIGAEVTCTRDQSGNPTDEKIYVTGSFLVGTIPFTVKYLAGQNLTIDCQLVGSNPVPLSTLVGQLCNSDATTVTWTSGFPDMADISFSNVSVQLVMGSNPQFELTGTMTVNGTQVNAFFLVQQINSKWEFALGINVQPNWSLPGFTNAFSAFNIDTSSWTVVASSFNQANFQFPPSFHTPAMASLDRGLDFYGVFTLANTLNTIQGVTTVLPSGTITTPTLTVHGLLADPLSGSYLEVILLSDANGVPLMGWDTVRLATFSLRLTAAPSFALHGDFIFKGITNPDGTFLHVILDLSVSLTEVQITFERQPSQGAIFTWQSAFGIESLSISLLDLSIGIIFAGPAFDGTIGGQVTFEHQENPTNSVRKNEPPYPWIASAMESKRQILAQSMPERYGDHLNLNYWRLIDQDGILVQMSVSFVILAVEPVPIPYKLSGHFVNFTLPYILKRFCDITIPSILMPIQFPDVSFDFELPNPLAPAPGQSLKFLFNGHIEIFGIMGFVDAEFDQTRIKFLANMDPILFSVSGYTIVQIAKSSTDLQHGPDIQIDSNPGQGQPQIGGNFYCVFFNSFITFQGQIQIRVDLQNPANSKIFFSFSGNVGSLANLSLTIVYQQTSYVLVNGSFNLNLTTNNIPGFNKDGIQVADGVDLSKCNSGTGVVLAGSLLINLDATNPSNPNFTMGGSGTFAINLGTGCNINLHLDFTLVVNEDSMSQIPSAVATQLLTNTANIFGALIQTAACFVELLKIGILIFEDAVKVAKVLADIFSTGIEKGAQFLEDLGHGAYDVAKSLWDSFSSHDTESNTKAMKDAGYNSDSTADAVKQVADQGGQPYQPQDLVRDQASAGYSAPQVTGGLCSAFTNYTSLPVDAGQLLANSQLTSFNPTQVAAGLRAQYGSRTTSASQMVSILSQVYTGGSALTAQQMANALAPIYPAAEVAQVLRNHYPNDTQTASAMALLLVTAYTAASNPLNVNQLAGALAPLYSATTVAPVLSADFGPDTNTALKLGTILNAAYVAPATPLTATTMAAALAVVFTTPSAIVTALQSLFPPATTTAAMMGALLLGAYPSINVSQMASALIAGGYPATDIGAVLKQDFPSDAGTPLAMTQVLAAAGYTAAQVAPVLTTIFASQAGTATLVMGFLQQGFLPAQIDAPTMAGALKAAPFTPVQAAPALKTGYAAQTQTANAMALLLIGAYGAQAISAQLMAQVLAASPYPAATTAGTAQALITQYATSTVHALDMSKLLQLAPYTVANVGPALQEFYPSETTHASNMASIFAQTPFDAPSVAPILKTLYPAEVGTATTMASVLTTAYSGITVQTMASALAASPYAITDAAPVLKVDYPTNTATAAAMYTILVAAYQPAPTAQSMASALAVSPYPAPQTAGVLKTNYMADAGTANQLVVLLKAAYNQPPIVLTDMLAALVATNFSAYEMAPAVNTAYTPTPQNLGSGLVQALTSAPPSAMQLGSAVTAASLTAANTALAVRAGLPSTDVGLMAAVLIIAGDSNMLPALTAAEGRKTAGDTAAIAAPKIVLAIPSITGMVLATALDAVYGPPNLDLQTLSNTLPGSFTSPDATSIAQGLLTAFPATTTTALTTALTTAFQSASKPLTSAQAVVAVASAFTFVGAPLSQSAFAGTYVQAVGASATPNAVATTIVTVFGAAATAATITPALVAGFTGTATLVDARIASIAVQQALNLTSTQADLLTTPLATTFNLIRCPNDVGVLAVALKAGGFVVNSTSAALSAYFGASWSAQAFAIVGSVYSQPAWNTAVTQRVAGALITAAAPAIYTANAPNAALMVQVLAGVYDLNQTSAAIVPMANALKAVTQSGQKVYTLNEASAAMSAQYSPDWNAQNFQQFISIYSS